jgi:glycolate oxidase FAD binding subunit
VGLPSHAVAGAFLAALVDSPLQPDRAALLDATGLRRAGLTADPVALLLSIGSVAEAVAQQGHALEALATGQGGRVEPIAEPAWSALGAAVDAPVLLRLASEPRRLLDWAELGQAAAGRLGVEMALLAQPGHGVLQMAVESSPDPRRLAQELVRPLRAAVEAEGGSLVVERAPIELKSICEVWGSIHPEILSIMKRIKVEFDPDDVLSPGRFVGGL